jgi:hypothetical protein
VSVASPLTCGSGEVTGRCTLFLILENGHSQEQAPGVTPENAAGQPPQRAGLTPENAELLTEYGGYLERSHLAGPSRCCGGRAGQVRRTGGQQADADRISGVTDGRTAPRGQAR